MNDKNFQAAIQLLLKASFDGKPQHEAVLEVCHTPSYLMDFGFPQLPIVITGAVVDKAHFEHGITRGVLGRLGEILLKPKALYRSATQLGNAVVVAFEQKNGSPILVPLRPDQLIGRTRFNKVSSLYTKEATIEDRWKSNGLLIWSQK